ncbi:MAG: hypothetical protein ACRD15_01655 [Vicinamibacterales bacterium]
MRTPADILGAARRRWPAVLRAEAAGATLFSAANSLRTAEHDRR